MDKIKDFLENLNFHYVFAGAMLVMICIIGVRLYIWDNNAHIIVPENTNTTEYDTEPVDNLIMYTYDAEPKDPSDMIIACFGNAPFSDDYGKANNLSNLISEATDATVYNFSFEDSYLSCEKPILESSSNDLFSLYWLTTIFTVDNDVIVDRYLEANPNTSLERKARLSLLQNLDFNDVDVITIMYDGSDYLAERGMYNRDDSENITHFGGALEASINLIKNNFPHIQIIVLSPTYAYGLEEDGSYVDSTLKTYGDEGPLASYSQYESEVCLKTLTSFIDNFYGTIHYFNADKHLSDHIHIKPESRSLLVDRFMEAYNFYLRFRNDEN